MNLCFQLWLYTPAADRLDDQKNQASSVQRRNRQQIHHTEIRREQNRNIQQIHPHIKRTFVPALLIRRSDRIDHTDRSRHIIELNAALKQKAQA